MMRMVLCPKCQAEDYLYCKAFSVLVVCGTYQRPNDPHHHHGALVKVQCIHTTVCPSPPFSQVFTDDDDDGRFLKTRYFVPKEAAAAAFLENIEPSKVLYCFPLL